MPMKAVGASEEASMWFPRTMGWQARMNRPLPVPCHL
jgi:hypothetical protein